MVPTKEIEPPVFDEVQSVNVHESNLIDPTSFDRIYRAPPYSLVALQFMKLHLVIITFPVVSA